MDYKLMTLDDIISWCQENGQDKIDWLKATSKKTFPAKDKDGKSIRRKITFIELKLAFAEKYMSDILPKAKKKNESMWDRIENL